MGKVLLRTKAVYPCNGSMCNALAAYLKMICPQTMITTDPRTETKFVLDIKITCKDQVQIR